MLRVIFDFPLFFKRKVGDNDPVDAESSAAREELIVACVEYWVQVSKEDERNVGFAPERPDQLEYLFHCGSGAQGADIRRLNDFALGDRVGKGNSDFYKVLRLASRE